MLCIAVPSIITLEYPNKQEVYLGYASMILGLAYTIGPVIAGAVYFKLDYTYTLYFFAIVIAIVGFGSIYFLPARLNKSEGVASEDGQI